MNITIKDKTLKYYLCVIYLINFIITINTLNILSKYKNIYFAIRTYYILNILMVLTLILCIMYLYMHFRYSHIENNKIKYKKSVLSQMIHYSASIYMLNISLEVYKFIGYVNNTIIVYFTLYFLTVITIIQLIKAIEKKPS